MKKITKNLIWLCIVVLILVASIPIFYTAKPDEHVNTAEVNQDPVVEAKTSALDKELYRSLDVTANIIKDREERARFNKCKLAVREVLKEPLSFDYDAGTTHHSVDPDTKYNIVCFKFYARNGFNRYIYSKAICSFDENDKLVDFGTFNL